MTFSKSLTLLLITSVFALSGCSVDSKKGKSALPGEQSRFKNADGTNFDSPMPSAKSHSVFKDSQDGAPTGKLVTFKSCLVNMDGSPMLPDLRFKISDGLGNDKTATTDVNGCLTWSESYSIDGYDKSTFYKWKRTITAIDSYRGEVYVEAAFNTGAEGDVSLVDLRYEKLPANVRLNETQGIAMKGQDIKSTAPMELVVNSISFDNLGGRQDYEVDPQLNLVIKQPYRVTLRPQIRRQTLSSNYDMVGVKKGSMDVTITLVRDVGSADALEAKNVITSFTFTGTIDNKGDLVADILVKMGMEELSSKLSRSMAVVTITPKGELANIPETSFMGLSAPGIFKDIDLIPTPQRAQMLAQKWSALKRAQALASKPVPLKAFVQGAQPLNRPDLEERIEKFLAGKMVADEIYGLKMLLCNQLTKGVAKAYCAYPDSRISVIGRDIVEGLNSPSAELKSSSNGALTFLGLVDYSVSETSGTNYTQSGGLSGAIGLSGPNPKIGFPISGSAKFSVGKDWFSASSSSKSRVTKASYSTTRSISVLARTFEIDVNARSCLLVGQIPHTVAPQLPEIYYYCSSKPTPQKRLETYYLLNEQIGDDGAGFGDTTSPRAATLRTYARGPKGYLAFSEFLKSSNEEQLILEKMPETQLLNESLHMIQEGPGILSPR